MNFLYSDDVIIACSTPRNANAAIGLIRISGFKDIHSFDSFFSIKLGPIEPRKVYFTNLLSGTEVVDEVCLTFFKGPNSYNGENILELSVHGNTLNIDRILNLFTKSGLCRLAAPGEFTYRALKHKKLSLSQVEGLDLLLNANSGYALDQGLSLLHGKLHSDYLELHDYFLKHKSSLELSIDFSEDVGEEAAKEHFFTTLKQFSNKFESLYKRSLPLEFDLGSPEIVLMGLPNSGKSSLFNFLLSENRAIVSSIAGTTRDFISETYFSNGIRFKLVDTAGVRHSQDEIESEGIRRSKEKFKEAFFTILLINPFEMNDSFFEILNHHFDVAYFTHSDREGFKQAREEVTRKYPKLGSIGPINLKNPSKDFESILAAEINKKYLDKTKNNPILIDRHRDQILKSHDILKKYVNTASYESDVAILSSELNTLGHCISELIGIISPDEILNSIFSNFCIGK